MTLENARNEVARIENAHAGSTPYVHRMEKLRRGQWVACTNEDGSVCYGVRCGNQKVVVDGKHRFVPA